jgi:hypothetical protein
MPSTGRRP